MFHSQKRGVINYSFDIGPNFHSLFEQGLAKYMAVTHLDVLRLK